MSQGPYDIARECPHEAFNLFSEDKRPPGNPPSTVMLSCAGCGIFASYTLNSADWMDALRQMEEE